MGKRNDEITQALNEKEDAQGRLWPSPAYTQQIEGLKNAIGKKVYFVELKPSDINMGIRLSDTGHPSLPQESTLHFFSCLPAGVSAQFRLVSALIPMGSGRDASRRVFKRRLDT
jgi:hypothetical protein